MILHIGAVAAMGLFPRDSLSLSVYLGFRKLRLLLKINTVSDNKMCMSNSLVRMINDASPVGRCSHGRVGPDEYWNGRTIEY